MTMALAGKCDIGHEIDHWVPQYLMKSSIAHLIVQNVTNGSKTAFICTKEGKLCKYSIGEPLQITTTGIVSVDKLCSIISRSGKHYVIVSGQELCLAFTENDLSAVKTFIDVASVVEGDFWKSGSQQIKISFTSSYKNDLITDLEPEADLNASVTDPVQDSIFHQLRLTEETLHKAYEEAIQTEKSFADCCMKLKSLSTDYAVECDLIQNAIGPEKCLKNNRRSSKECFHMVKVSPPFVINEKLVIAVTIPRLDQKNVLGTRFATSLANRRNSEMNCLVYTDDYPNVYLVYDFVVILDNLGFGENLRVEAVHPDYDRSSVIQVNIDLKTLAKTIPKNVTNALKCVYEELNFTISTECGGDLTNVISALSDTFELTPVLFDSQSLCNQAKSYLLEYKNNGNGELHLSYWGDQMQQRHFLLELRSILPEDAVVARKAESNAQSWTPGNLRDAMFHELIYFTRNLESPSLKPDQSWDSQEGLSVKRRFSSIQTNLNTDQELSVAASKYSEVRTDLNRLELQTDEIYASVNNLKLS